MKIMNKYIKSFMLAGMIVLSGCADYDFEDYGGRLKINSKQYQSPEYSRYAIRGYDSMNSYMDLILVLPNNFGEVNYIVTITNGIVAHKP
jgi:hypothetical protein